MMALLGLAAAAAAPAALRKTPAQIAPYPPMQFHSVRAHRARPGRLSGQVAFPIVNRFCVGLLYRRAGRLTPGPINDDFWPRQFGEFKEHDEINEANMLGVAAALRSSGMAAAGYDTINVVCNGWVGIGLGRIVALYYCSYSPFTRCTNIIIRYLISKVTIATEPQVGRDATTGQLLENRTLWPNGIKGLAAKLHDMKPPLKVRKTPSWLRSWANFSPL
jgi:hypothetical protein